MATQYMKLHRVTESYKAHGYMQGYIRLYDYGYTKKPRIITQGYVGLYILG